MLLFVEFFKNIINSRAILKHFVKRDLKVKYRNSIIGFFWTFLKPFFIFLIINFVFSLFLKFEVKTKYSYFLLISLFPWLFFQGSITDATYSIINTSSLIKKVGFPREIVPISFCISHFIHFLLSYFVITSIILILSKHISFKIIFVPFILFLLFLFSIGIGLILSSLNVFFRDIGHSLEIILMLMFYATPIFYPVNLALNSMEAFHWHFIFKYIYLLNPMLFIVLSLRMSLLYPQNSFIELPKIVFLKYACVEIFLIIFIFFIGIYVFKKLEPAMLDVI